MMAFGEISSAIKPLIDRLCQTIEKKGYDFKTVPTLQCADKVIDLSGEKARSWVYLIENAHQTPLCLRHDLTLPLAGFYQEEASEQFIPSGMAYPRKLASAGWVYRRGESNDNNAEHYQIDFEHFHANDTSDDFDCVALALEALEAVGVTDVTLHFNDLQLITSSIDALGLPQKKAEILKRSVWNHKKFLNLLARYGTSNEQEASRQAFLSALSEVSPDKASLIVETLMKEGSAPETPSRSRSEIIRRLLSQAQAAAEPIITPEQTQHLIQLSSLKGNIASIRTFLQNNKALPEAQTEAFLQTLKKLEMLALNYNVKLVFDASMGRGMEYYTGLVFDIIDGSGTRLAGGGRYDGLLQAMGSKTKVPAVGCCLNPLAIARIAKGEDE